MARRQEIQKPTTLLTTKQTKLESIDYDGNRGEIMLSVNDAGAIGGDVRIITNEQYTISYANTADPQQNYNRQVYKTLPLHNVGSLIYYAGTSQPDGYLFCNGAWVMAKLYFELYEKMRNSDYAGGSQIVNGVVVGGQYWGGEDNCVVLTNSNYSSYGFSQSDVGELVFKIPDLRGFYIRNHNPGIKYNTGSNLHPLPDYETNVTYDEFGEELDTEDGIRTWGSKQDSRFSIHSHTANTVSVSGNHVHEYEGGLDATGGTQLGVNTAGNVDPASGKQHWATFGARTMLTDPAGYHRHFGWLGYGTSYSDTEHKTVDFEGNQSANETRPKTYQVMVCIKY